MATDPRSYTKGAETCSRSQDGEPQRGRGRNKQLSQHLQIPKNRSTGNLAVVSEGAEESQKSPRFRFSFDTGSGATLDYDSITRYVSGLLVEHYFFSDDDECICIRPVPV